MWGLAAAMSLGGGDQLRAHGAGEGDENLEVRGLLDGLECGLGLARPGPDRAGGVVEAQDEGGELMPAGTPWKASPVQLPSARQTRTQGASGSVPLVQGELVGEGHRASM